MLTDSQHDFKTLWDHGFTTRLYECLSQPSQSNFPQQATASTIFLYGAGELHIRVKHLDLLFTAFGCYFDLACNCHPRLVICTLHYAHEKVCLNEHA
ncbi:hypothetical protein NG55_01450 [Acinetobacter gyllenbergii]|nr:hypothetical protein NG55_01450 [Acinetobacter gyllenbergii]